MYASEAEECGKEVLRSVRLDGYLWFGEAIFFCPSKQE